MPNNCIDCFDNCPEGKAISDRCIRYTGPDIECIGVCTNDTLYDVEAAIIEKLCAVLDGSSIDLSALSYDCDFINDILDGDDKTLANVIQALLTASCTLKELIDEINATVGTVISINAPCLTIPANPTLAQVVQALATKVCDIDDRLIVIENDYVKDSDLCAKVELCIAGSASTQYSSRMVPFVAYPYHGSLSNFDANGTGLTANGFEKVYLCVGQTISAFVLPDYRGRSPVGANTGVPGGAMDSAVDPAIPANAGYSLVNKTKKGNYTHTLTVVETAAHTHSIIDPGHSHDTNFSQQSRPCAAACTAVIEPGGNILTDAAVTGITINSTGGGQPHNNTHPVMGCHFIMFIP